MVGVAAVSSHELHIDELSQDEAYDTLSCGRQQGNEYKLRDKQVVDSDENLYGRRW